MQITNITSKLPRFKVPSHRATLGQALDKAYQDRQTVKTGSRRSWNVRRIGIAAVPVAALCLAVAVTLTLVVSPTPSLAAKVQKWYEGKMAGGRWEHVLINVKTSTHMLSEDIHNFDYEMWRDTETGNIKGIVRDAATGKPLETLIAIRAGLARAEEGNRPDNFTYHVYSDKPEGRGKSFFEELTDLTDEEGMVFLDESKTVAVSLGKPGIYVGEVVETLPNGEYPEGVEPPPPLAPLEFDSTRVSLLDGKGKSFMENGHLTQKGEETLNVLGTKALVVTNEDLKWPIKWPTNPMTEAVFDTNIYLQPGTYAYLGASTALSRKGKEIWKNCLLYKEYEFTNEAPSMDTGSLRQLGGRWAGKAMFPDE